MTNREVIQKVYAAFEAGDIPAFLALLDPEIAWYPAENHPYAPDGKPWIGTESLVRDFLQRLGPDWQGFTSKPDRLHDAGDVIIAEGRYGGVHNATGDRIDAQFCHLWTVKNDSVTAFRQYTDTAQLRSVAGVA